MAWATIVVGVLVFIPATLSAVAAMRTRGDLRTNSGKPTGYYIEEGALATFHQTNQMNDLAAALADHMEHDVAQFAMLHDVLSKQYDLAVEVKETLEESKEEP